MAYKDSEKRKECNRESQARRRAPYRIGDILDIPHLPSEVRDALYRALRAGRAE